MNEQSFPYPIETSPKKPDIFSVLKEPTEEQITQIKHFIGEAAFTKIEQLGATILVPKEEELPIAPRGYGRYERPKATMNFHLRYEQRIISFFCKEQLKDSSKSLLSNNPENPQTRDIEIEFLFEEDYLNLKSGKVSITDLLFKKNSAFKKLATKPEGEGLAPTPYHFLLNLRNLVQAIDPECQINLIPSDKKRKRIYEKVFRKNTNIKVKSVPISLDSILDQLSDYKDKKGS